MDISKGFPGRENHRNKGLSVWWYLGAIRLETGHRSCWEIPDGGHGNSSMLHAYRAPGPGLSIQGIFSTSSTTCGWSNDLLIHFTVEECGPAKEVKCLVPGGQGWGLSMLGAMQGF